jgi:hypothetical protein
MASWYRQGAMKSLFSKKGFIESFILLVVQTRKPQFQFELSNRKELCSVSVSFIQALYIPFKPLPNDENEYKEMLSDDDFISIAPQIYQLLKNQGRLESTPLFFQEHIKAEFKKAFYQNLFIKNETEQILKKFDAAQIEVIPLKGPFFAEKYFGHIGARSTSDIDLLIKQSSVKQAKEIVKSLGFSIEEEAIEGHFHSSYSKVLPGSPIALVVELHWHLLVESSASFDVEEIWNEAENLKSYHYIKELSEYHTFYMICLHSWRHNLDSLRHFIDIIQVAYILRERLNFEQLRIDCEFHLTAKRMSRTLLLVHQQFPELPFIQNCHAVRSKNFLRKMAFKNRHKKGIWKYIDFIDYQLFSYDSLGHRLVHIKYLFK